MKKALFTILVSLIFLIISCDKKEEQNPGLTSVIYNGSLTFTSLSQLQQFYNAGYEVVQGNITIDSVNGLTDLTALSNIRLINDNMGGYTLKIWNCQDLTTLDGLNSIKKLNGHLSILRNPKLENLEGLNNLKTIGGHLYLTHCDSLTNIDALSNLESVGELNNVSGDIVMLANNNLANLDGLSNLLILAQDFKITWNTNLTDFCGIKPILTSGGAVNGIYYLFGNAYNPTEEEIIDGDCSL